MQINNTLFKKEILFFTLIQVALLSLLLILSVAVRLVLYPLSYLESLPLYFIVGFFFLWEMLQFFLEKLNRATCINVKDSIFLLNNVLFICIYLSYLLSDKRINKKVNSKAGKPVDTSRSVELFADSFRGGASCALSSQLS